MTHNTKKYETLLQEIKDPNARDFARGIVEYAIAEVVKETRKEEREKIRQWALKRAVRCDACFGHKGIPHDHRQSYISDLLEFLTPPDKEEPHTDCHSDTILTCMPPKYKCSTCGRVEDEAF